MPPSAAKTRRPSSRAIAHRSTGAQSRPHLGVVDDGIGVVLDHDPDLGFGIAGLGFEGRDHRDPGTHRNGISALSVRIGHRPDSRRESDRGNHQ